MIQKSQVFALINQTFLYSYSKAKLIELIPSDLFINLHHILQQMSMKTIESVNVSEKCAQVWSSFDAFAVVTEDLSLLTFGVNKLIRFVDCKMGLVKIIELDDVLFKLNIDMKQFVDMWILLGTDYSDHFKALKVNQIYEYIVELKGKILRFSEEVILFYFIILDLLYLFAYFSKISSECLYRYRKYSW